MLDVLFPANQRQNSFLQFFNSNNIPITRAVITYFLSLAMAHNMYKTTRENAITI